MMNNRLLNKQVGRSLVELMIAIVISMFILLAMVSLYVANNATSKATNDKARMDEDGRLALNLIAFHLRMAGYGTLVNADPTPIPGRVNTTFITSTGTQPQAIQGCTGGFNAPTTVAFTCTDVDTSPDAFLVRYEISSVNANALSGGLPPDCLGSGVLATTFGAYTTNIVENRFFVATNGTSSLPELYCVGNGQTPAAATTFVGTPQPIAENVSDMRITYGYDADGDQSADAFYTAKQINALATPNWSSVVSAKVCLVIRSFNNGVTTEAQKYRDCSDTLVTATDRRLYATYSTVITLRQRANGSVL